MDNNLQPVFQVGMHLRREEICFGEIVLCMDYEMW